MDGPGSGLDLLGVESGYRSSIPSLMDLLPDPSAEGHGLEIKTATDI